MQENLQTKVDHRWSQREIQEQECIVDALSLSHFRFLFSENSSAFFSEMDSTKMEESINKNYSHDDHEDVDNVPDVK